MAKTLEFSINVTDTGSTKDSIKQLHSVYILHRQTAVTAYVSRKQLLLFAFVRQYMHRQTAAAAYISSKQLLLFLFGR